MLAGRRMKVRVFVTGMQCDRCCHAVEAAIKTVPGFVSCTVKVGLAEIAYDESKAGKFEFVAAVRGAGAYDIERFEAVN